MSWPMFHSFLSWSLLCPRSRTLASAWTPCLGPMTCTQSFTKTLTLPSQCHRHLVLFISPLYKLPLSLKFLHVSPNPDSQLPPQSTTLTESLPYSETLPNPRMDLPINLPAGSRFKDIVLRIQQDFKSKSSLGRRQQELKCCLDLFLSGWS